MGINLCGNKNIVAETLNKPGKSGYSFSVIDIDSGKNNDSLVCNEDNLIEISVRCTNLSTENRFSLLCPIVYFYVEQGGEFVKTGETEVQTTTLNPSFESRFKVPFSMKSDYQVKVEVYDQAKPKVRDFIGSSIFNIHEIASSFEPVTKELMNQSKKAGIAIVGGKEVNYLNDRVEMQFEFFADEELEYCYIKLFIKEGNENTVVFQTESKQSNYSK